MAYSREQLLGALRNADSAGDTEGAKRIASMIQNMPQESTGAATAASTPVNNPTPQTQPTAPQNTTQTPTEGNESMMYAFTHPGESFGALGNAVGLGVTNLLTGDQAPTGAAKDWYNEQMANPETRANAQEVQNELPKQLAYGGAALATEGLSIPALEAIGISAPIASRVLGNTAGSIASQSVGDNGDITASQTIEDILGGEFIHGSLKSLSKIGKSAYNVFRETVPESIGGYSQTEKAANVANPNYISKVLQNDNPEAQYNYRMATSDDAGNSILTPSQTMNTQGGKQYIAAEQRNLRRDNDSDYLNRFNYQKSGQSLTNTVENPLYPPNSTLQETAGNITDAFKQRSNKLYEDSKNSAQSLLDSKRITSLKFNDSKNLAQNHLNDNTTIGGINLTPDTHKTLTQFNKTTFKNINDIDTWKRLLSEKANKAYRDGDFTSSNALRDVKNSLTGEADTVLNKIDPNAGGLYRDADQYYSESIGDFGKKSILGKIANKDNPDTAGNILFNNQDARYNIRQIYDAMNDAMNTGNIQDAHILSSHLADALGNESRIRALNAGNKGANFSNTRFANTLSNFKPQATTARMLNNNAGMSGSDQLAVNNALLDAVDTYRSSQPVRTPYHDAAVTLTGKGIGGAIGATTGGTVGLLAGQHIGGKITDALNRGVLDEFMGTNKNAKQFIQYMSDPVNAKAIKSVIDERAANGLNTGDEDLKRIVRSLLVSTDQTLHNENKNNDYNSLNTRGIEPIASTGYQSQPIGKEPPQRAQSVNTQDEFSPKATRLYRALAGAETGGLDNRFIRTKAAESGVSTAYGAAQLTVNTMKDFYSKHPHLFTDDERDYVHRFIDQGERMKTADKDDRTYGYGAPGVLGGKEDRRMYARVVRKMLNQMIDDNGGSLDKTVKQWRGANDPTYFSKVRQAFREAQ